MDNQSYLQVTIYLQNLSLIEESFNKASSHKNYGNSEAKAHKVGNKPHKKKHRKNHCRTHPHAEHVWADCYDNPKSKNYEGNRNNKGTAPKKRKCKT